MGLYESFLQFDKDKSGTLTPDEVVGILMREGTGAPLSESDARLFVSYFDKNGDGALNFEEFACAMGQPVIFGGVPIGTWNIPENVMGAEAVPMAEPVAMGATTNMKGHNIQGNKGSVNISTGNTHNNQVYNNQVYHNQVYNNNQVTHVHSRGQSAKPLPPSGKWSGGGHNQTMGGIPYSINFYLRFDDQGDKANVEGVAVPPTAFEGFQRITVRGTLDRTDNTARLDHPKKGGYTRCKFFQERGGQWRMTAEWYLPPDMSLLTGHIMPYNGTHDVEFTGDTRTTPPSKGFW